MLGADLADGFVFGVGVGLVLWVCFAVGVRRFAVVGSVWVGARRRLVLCATGFGVVRDFSCR
ncbi:MAG TPA: hypothetical protein VI094_03830 [Propionibacteriaceae bacterium]